MDTLQTKDIETSGLINIVDDPDATDEANAEARPALIQAAVDDLVKNAPITADVVDAAADPPQDPRDTILVQILDLDDGEFDIIYEKPGADQTVTLELDDPDVGVSLDRANYPKNTGVAVTIDDMAMNVDPTSEDSWFLVVGDASESRYGVTIMPTMLRELQMQQPINRSRSIGPTAQKPPTLRGRRTDSTTLEGKG